MNSTTDIIKAVQTYIETPDTKYAIMIDGEWGCGKTYFWKNTLLPVVGESEALYISMFSLKDIKDIENEIFKTLSFMGNDDDGVLKGMLNSGTATIDDVRFGGIGFVVQFCLKKLKDKKLETSKNLFICFDDLERWAGDIEVCLSYINKLVEHDGAKCLIIGNANEIEAKNKDKFNNTKEKTIGFKYKLTYLPEITLNAAVNLGNYPSPDCKTYIENLISENKIRIYDLLTSVKCSNIRTVSVGIHYLAIIYSNHKSKFEISPANAISYFISLLSTLILVEHYKNSDEDRKAILAPVNDVLELTEKLGINFLDGNKKIRKLSDEEKIIEYLIDATFYQTGDIKLQGKFSIISYGFYKSEDFEEEFTKWRKTEDYEYYLDTFKLLYMDDEEAERIHQSTYKAMLEEKNITDPYILLSLTDRILNNIKRGAINLDFEVTKDGIKKLFKELYEQKIMDNNKYIEPPYFERFKYCNDIYSEVIEQNDKYNESYNKIEISKFWIKLKANPDELDELMKKYKDYEIFSLYDNPEEIVDVIETLNNEQLFEFTRWMGSRLDGSVGAVEKEHERAQAIVEILEEKYINKFGVKAAHIKQISRILKNKSTNYAPEYIDESKEI
ncbi:MAG: P-loop NTPase fold protein [Methylococcales bacterium]|nr:P-loop NTPase fold protein [Methylococcales bacterium]